MSAKINILELARESREINNLRKPIQNQDYIDAFVNVQSSLVHLTNDTFYDTQTINTNFLNRYNGLKLGDKVNCHNVGGVLGNNVTFEIIDVYTTGGTPINMVEGLLADRKTIVFYNLNILQNSIPLIKFPTVADQKPCAICFSDENLYNNIPGDDYEAVILPCGHIYHRSCVTRWRDSHEAWLPPRPCPNCRGPVNPIRSLQIDGNVGTPLPGRYHFGGSKKNIIN
jgi:hypothetical protein